jgi:hypothetical protein
MVKQEKLSYGFEENKTLDHDVINLYKSGEYTLKISLVC